MFTFIKVPKIKNRYLFFLAKSFLFLLLVFMVDFSVGYLFKWLYLKQQSGNEYRTKYSIEDTKADILLFGSSRSQQQYNPQYFQQRLNLSCYNVGREGLSILYQYPLLKAVTRPEKSLHF